MIRRRKLRARSARYPRRWPAVIGWSLAGLVAAAVPLVLAYLRGRQTPTRMGETPNAVFETLTQAIPAATISCLALIALAWCIRRLSFEAMAYRPGRIEVPAFTAEPGVTADPAQLTMVFRQRLAVLSLSAPTPVPGASGEGDFLDVLGREKLDTGNLAGSIVTLMRAAKPNHAWQVSGLLVQRERAPRCGVTLQVAQLPLGGNPPHTVWADSYEAAARRAADHATAAVLPRTKQCREPWAAWKHFLMPGELLAAHEDGVRLESERRYDEALDAFYRASGLDPMNMALRLKIGQLQEKLGLYIDALMTYEGMIEVSVQAPAWRPFRYAYAARSQRRRSLVAARYRRIVLLGGAELADQWRRTGPPDPDRWTARDERRFELRSRLRRSLSDRLAEVDKRHLNGQRLADPGRRQTLTALRRCGTDDPRWLLSEASLRPAEDRERFALRELFALLALHELEGLSLRRLRFRDRRLQLTPAAVRLTQICIEVRLAWIQANLVPMSSNGNGPCWPPHPARLQARVEGIEGKHVFGRWHEHYNAACAYALPLLADPPTAPVCPAPGAPDEASLSPSEVANALQEELAGLAVERLARATSCADSGYIAGRREWLISEDPDLDGLRSHQRFREFEAMYFPSERPTPPRPRHVRQLESARYIRNLLAETASRWEREWHRRGRELDKRTDVHLMLEWWRTELEAWELVRQVALDHRHWPARLALIGAMRGWATDYGFRPLDVAFHRYEDEPLCDAAGTLLCVDANEPAARAERRLAEVHASLPDASSRRRSHVLLRSLEKWQSTLRQLDIEGEAPDRMLLATLCDRHAALWQLLKQWLSEDTPVRQQACRTAFVEQITRHDETVAARAASLNGRRRGKRGTGSRPPAARRG